MVRQSKELKQQKKPTRNSFWKMWEDKIQEPWWVIGSKKDIGVFDWYPLNSILSFRFVLQNLSNVYAVSIASENEQYFLPLRAKPNYFSLLKQHRCQKVQCPALRPEPKFPRGEGVNRTPHYLEYKESIGTGKRMCEIDIIELGENPGHFFFYSSCKFRVF